MLTDSFVTYMLRQISATGDTIAMDFRPFYGNAVSGDQRFPRPELEAELIRLLESSGGIKMFQLRRIGKSTFMLVAREEMERRGTPVIHLDAQGLRSPGQLLLRVLSAMPRQDSGLPGRLLSWVSGDAAVPTLLRDGLQAALRGILHQDAGTEEALARYWPTLSAKIVSLLREDKRAPLLCIDEFTYLLKNMLDDAKGAGRGQVDNLLASLREWRGAGMKMLLAGSIGLSALARQHGFNREHLNDLEPFQIPPLNEAEARALVETAVETAHCPSWTDVQTSSLLEETGVFYPSFLVKGLITIGLSAPPPVERFAEIFATRVRPNLHDSFLQQLTTRFAAYRMLDADQQRALIVPMMRQIMQAGQSGLAHSALKIPDSFQPLDVDDALAMLGEDGFLAYHVTRESERIWRPASALVPIWWKQARL